MCDFTHLTRRSVISPVARVIRSHITRRDVVGPFDGRASIQGLWWLGHHHADLHSENILREHLFFRSELMTHTEHFTYLIHLESFTHTQQDIYICIYIYILCVERERERESRITRKGSMQIRQTRRQYSKLLSLRACLYINRHALVSLSVCGVCNLQRTIRIRNWTVDNILFHAYRTI